MIPTASTSITTPDPLMATLATQQQELLTETLSNIRKFVSDQCWYSACSLAAALSDETNRKKMGYFIITRFLKEPLIDGDCLLCEWKMCCANCQRLGRRFFERLSQVAFSSSSERTVQISAIACLQMIASIWPDTSSNWVYLTFQASLQSRHIMDTLSFAVYLEDQTVLRFIKYCSSFITDLAKEGKWGLARRIDSIAASCAMAKGLPFTSPLCSKIMGKML